MPRTPEISFLIATDDHPPDLDRFFDALISQTLAPGDYEVLIIDCSRTGDYTVAHEKAMKRKDPAFRLEYVQIEKGGRASAYNHGLPLARAPIILFFGHDYIAAPQTAEAHLRFHRDNLERHFVGVGSAFLRGEFAASHFSRWLESSGELFGFPFSDDMASVPENFFYSGNASVKRELLDAVGPFEEGFRHHAWDDYELGLRMKVLGMKAVYVPGAKAEHVHIISLVERRRAMVHAGEAAFVFERKYGRNPWADRVGVIPWRGRLSGWKSWMLHKLSRDEDDLIAYYRAMLAVSFSQGYRRAACRNLAPAINSD